MSGVLIVAGALLAPWLGALVVRICRRTTRRRRLEEAALYDGLPDPDIARARRGSPVRWIALSTGVGVMIAVAAVVPRLGSNPSDEVSAHTPLLGRVAPSFDLPDARGGPAVSSVAFAGHVYVVNFFASWCPDCVAETGQLIKFYDAWHRRGVDMVGIGYGDTRAAEAIYANQWGVPYPVLTDPADQMALHYGVFGIPETFVVDSAGVIAAKLVGSVGPGQLAATVRHVEAGSTSTSARSKQFQPLPAPSGPSRG